MPRIPFLDRLRQHRTERDTAAQDIVLAAARELALGKSPRDVDRIVDALSALQLDEDDLEGLAESFARLHAMQAQADAAPSAEAELHRCRELEAAAVGEFERERDRLHALVQQAVAETRRANTALQAARDSARQVSEVRRSILAIVDPQRVAHVASETRAIGARLLEATKNGRVRARDELRQQLERTRRELPTLDPNRRRNAERDVAEMESALHRIEREAAAEEAAVAQLELERATLLESLQVCAHSPGTR